MLGQSFEIWDIETYDISFEQRHRSVCALAQLICAFVVSCMQK